MAVGIFYGSSGGNTENVAKMIGKALSVETELIDIADAVPEDFDKYISMIIGTSTWGDGDLQDDWEEFYDELDSIDLSGKTVAFFGLGDQEGYGEVFCNAMGILHAKVTERGAGVVGDRWPTDGYDFEESEAVRDGAFVGLVIDEDNQDDLTQERVDGWTKSINHYFIND